ncbi:class I SAM-dependent methyltransferase [Glycomyces tenuis]|uniref:class I SAM-dependent methyltransferase n=1 Tax=Glycomyces tenuis TaxID=58116 RepID=UPI00041AC089|nr:class I SAM-dependent methyltransferase [Glycomyces tenuis]
MSEQTTKRRFQSGENYRRGAGNLKAREGIFSYRRPQVDMPGMVIDRIGPDPKRILDVGCGSGRYLLRLRESFPEAEVIGVDRSPGMLEALPEPTVQADVCELPFGTGSADAVLAMHMLYHVPELETALDELERVLAPGGVLFASTLASDDRPEYTALWREATRKALGAEAKVEDTHRVVLDHFSQETAQAMLSERFASVRLHDLPGVIELPEPGPLVAAYRSTSSFVDLEAEDFERVMAQIEAELDRHFAAEDLFRMTVHTGILECRDPRRP